MYREKTRIMLVTRRAVVLSSIAALAAGRRASAQETIKIGQIAPATGPNAQNGRFMMNGARLAVESMNRAGGILGKPIELIGEDDQTTNPGAVLAFSRLVSRGDVAAYLGPPSSTQTHAIAPDVLKTGRPLFLIGSDPALTHMGNPWLFRCRAHDAYSARVMAEYGVKDLGKRNWAVVYSTDAFGTAAMKLLINALDKLGVKPALVQGYVNQQGDFTPVVLAVKQSGADIIGSYFTFPTDLAVFARQIRQLGVTGSQSIATATALSLAGSTLSGTLGIVDFAPESSPEAAAFAARYEQVYKSPADAFASLPYDAVTVLTHAINAAGSTDPEAIRKAILATQGLRGVNGTLSFDANGDGMRGLNIVRNDGGKIAFIRRIEFND
jgi:branched-chain amino acid transport system substrate-binding protein